MTSARIEIEPGRATRVQALRPPGRGRIGAGVALLAALLAAPAAADSKSDHDQALQALLRGEIIALDAVLEAVKAEVQGTVVAVKLDKKDNAWIYELKVISRAGVLTKIIVDARTGRMMAARQIGK